MQALILLFSKFLPVGFLGNPVDKLPVRMVSYFKCSGGGYACLFGEMSERLKEPVLKTGDAQASVGSNPTLSAMFFFYIGCAEVPKRPKGLPC